MKSPEQVLREIRNRLAARWVGEVVGGEPGWPHQVPLGSASTADLKLNFGDHQAEVLAWRAWAAQRGLAVAERTRRVYGGTHPFPTHLLVPDLASAATLAGDGWPERLPRARERLAVLRARFPQAPEAAVLARVADLSDLDFDLLCRAADWFAENGGAGGLTPRQVPVEGMHAKWLNTRQELVRQLSGLDDLGLAPRHPARLHLTYLDPDHRAAGGRLHDCASVGDRFVPAYPVEVVVISENKDTAVAFPELHGAVSVEGVGRGGSTAAAFDWLREAPLVVYWGDLDADGLEILDGFRAVGVPARSVLMDMASYAQWSRWGTAFDKAGAKIGPRAPRATPHLDADERSLYLKLTAPVCDGYRRVEQERIPLPVALAAVEMRQRSIS